MTAEEEGRLYKLAHLIRQVAGLGRLLAREKGMLYGKDSWGDAYQRVFDDFDRAMAELEQLCNPDQLSPNHPDHFNPKALLPSQPPTGLDAVVGVLLQLGDTIIKARKVDDVASEIRLGGHVLGCGPRLIRVLRTDKSILEQAEMAAHRLEELLAQGGRADQSTAGHPEKSLRIER